MTRLLATLNNLDHMLIGGHAVIFRGIPRSTFDLDLLAKKSQRLEWHLHLEPLGYRIFHESDNFQQWTSPLGHPALDLMLVEDETYVKMCAASDFVDVGLQVRVVSPIHLIALKLHAMRFRPADLCEKDWQDILGVISTQQLNSRDHSLLEVVQKYADPTTKERFFKHYGI